MNQPDYRQAIEDYIRAQAQPTDKFSHQPRLYQLAVKIGKEEGQKFDDDVLHAAAWMHDLGVFIGHRPEDIHALAAWDNVAYAMKRAPELLTSFGFPSDRIPAVIDAIRTHLPGRDPIIIEGELLRDADILEQLGAIGALRTISKIGRDTRFVRFEDALQVLRRNLEELPGKLRLASARKLAAPRVAALQAFLEAASSEAAGQLL
jgi:uncharacterized protein